MKKIIAIALVLLALLGAYVLYQNHNINPSQVTQINIYEENEKTPVHSYFQTDTEAIEKITEIFNNLKGSSASSTDLNTVTDNYVLDIITEDGDVYSYDLSINLDGMKLDVYDNKSQQFLYPSYDQIKSLLSTEGFYGLYETNAPRAELTYSTITIPAQVSNSQWVYTLADGSEMDKSIQNAVNPANASIMLNPDFPISIYTEKVPQQLSLKVFSGQDLIREEIIEQDQFMPSLFDGQLRYEVKCTWGKSNDLAPFGTSTLTFYGNMDIEPELKMDKSKATAGDVVVLEIFNVNEGQTPKINQTLSKDLKIWKADDRYFAFLAMNYWAKPGEYNLELEVTGTDKTYKKSYPLVIESKAFNKQYLTVDKKVEANTRNDAAYEEYAKYFTPVRDTSVGEKLWEGPFIKPVEGRISTEFGEMRYVNGALTSYRHSGIDIAAPADTQIVAPNHGVVVLSQNLILTGETIVIDHGYGIFSVYFHMNRRDVSLDESVSKGQAIGTVGSTGFSTGPHLHWTMSHYKTNLSPWLFMERELIDFE